jgi:hypothetical protein
VSCNRNQIPKFTTPTKKTLPHGGRPWRSANASPCRLRGELEPPSDCAVPGAQYEKPPDADREGCESDGCWCFRVWLNTQDVFSGFRGLAGGDHEPSLVIRLAEDVQPALYVSSSVQVIVLHDVGLQSEVGGSHFGYEFFLRIHFATEAVVFDERLAAETRLMTCGVDQLVEEREVIILGSRERPEGGHENGVCGWPVERRVMLPLHDDGPLRHFGDQPFGGFDALRFEPCRPKRRRRELNPLDLRRQSRRTGMLLNTDELTGFVHLPTSAVASPKLRRDTGRTRPAPAHLTDEADLLLGINCHAGQEAAVWLRADHRIRHTHVIGGSGYGKTTFLFNCIRQDIENGNGCGLLDPHGDLADRLLDFIPRDRVDDVVLVDPTDEEASVGFNILAAHSDFEKDLIASDLVAVFRRQSSSWGEQMESVLHHAILAFLESSRGGTIADLKNFLLDAGTRSEFLKTVQDPDVVFYWKKGFPQLGGTRSIGPVVTRLEKFLSRKPVKRMVSQRVNTLDFADILDSGKIFIVKLPQGQIGAENAYLLGTLLVSKFQQMAMARQRMREEERRPFFLYVDEAANFLTPSMAEILSGARKYKMGLILSHQSLSQLKAEPLVAGALDSSACTRIVFRVGDQDARALAEGFSHFDSRKLQNLSVGEAVCRVERSDVDFNLQTLPALGVIGDSEYAERGEVVTRSRATYGTPTAAADEISRHSYSRLPVEDAEQEDAPEPQAERAPEPRVRENVSAPAATFAPPKDEPAPEPLVEAPHGEAAQIAKPYRPTEVRADIEALGRGGELHRSAQNELKLLAESLGFRATIERQLPGSQDTVDLHLQREDREIGCEITVTNTLDYEIRNVLKLLRAKVPTVAMIALDSEKLSRLEPAIRNSLSPEDNMKVHFFAKEQFIEFLQSLALESPPLGKSKAPVGSKKVKGWAVKRTVVQLSPEELKQREGEIAAAIGDNVRRKTAENRERSK